DQKAALILEAMAYNVAKWIGAMATVFEGRVDAIVLTGGLAYYQDFVEMIKKRCSFIAPVKIYPGEDEMRALLEGALRVLRGEEKAKIYENEIREDKQ
ncbi:MAG: butyrate kinase, partial [Candidatus Saccharicenans sp.]